jgi:hypothetical protein
MNGERVLRKGLVELAEAHAVGVDFRVVSGDCALMTGVGPQGGSLEPFLARV